MSSSAGRKMTGSRTNLCHPPIFGRSAVAIPYLTPTMLTLPLPGGIQGAINNSDLFLECLRMTIIPRNALKFTLLVDSNPTHRKECQYADTARRDGRYAKISFTFSRTCWLREGFRSSIVLSMSEWPSHCCTVRRSTPAHRHRVSKVARNLCSGEIPWIKLRAFGHSFQAV